ncbi:calcineurin-like phosphoesterase [archaeon]|nr:calcineurin-like phosphoesterase [archaeon]
MINKIEPDLVIVTGDLTTWGLHPEFREAYEALLNLKSDMIVILGNHDSRNSGSKFFELYFGKSRKHLVIDDFVIVAADSTQPDRDEGYIGAWQRRWIEKKFEWLDYIISFNPEINLGNVFWDIPEPRDTDECKKVVRILHREIHSLVSEIIKGNYNIS